MIALTLITQPAMIAKATMAGVRKVGHGIAVVAGWLNLALIAAIFAGGPIAMTIELISNGGKLPAAMNWSLLVLGYIFCGWVLFVTFSKSGKERYAKLKAETSMAADIQVHKERIQVILATAKRLPPATRFVALAVGVGAVLAVSATAVIAAFNLLKSLF